MAVRYDKYDPISGGFRAPLAAAVTPNSAGEFGPVGVSLNASGRVVPGSAGTSGLAGVLVKNAPKLPVAGGMATPFLPGYNAMAPMGLQAGDVVDVMTSGEIINPNGFNGIAAGSAVYAAAADGALTATATGNIKIGWLVEATRLVVRVAA